MGTVTGWDSLTFRTGSGFSDSPLFSSESGRNDTWFSDSQGRSFSDGEGGWSTLFFVTGDNNNLSRDWTVGGETSDGDFSGNDGTVGESSSSGGGEGRGCDNSRELHC